MDIEDKFQNYTEAFPEFQDRFRHRRNSSHSDTTRRHPSGSVFAIVPLLSPIVAAQAVKHRREIAANAPDAASGRASAPVYLTARRRSSESPAAVAIVPVEGGNGVDLAQVGRALGLDPATVRLNGYFLSHGSRHVSLSVTWGALLAFLAARGLPTGADPAAPVAVQGRSAPSTPLSEPRVIQSSKRKSRLATVSCSKKSKLQHNSSALSKYSEDLLSDDITLGLKRRLRLDEATPSKKIKQVDYSSVSGAEVSGAETQQPVKFSSSFINGHSKRLQDEEMVTSLPCKRVRTVQ